MLTTFTQKEKDRQIDVEKKLVIHDFITISFFPFGNISHKKTIFFHF